MNISFLEKNIEEIIAIDDVFLPPIVHTVINSSFPKYKKELFDNQQEFIHKYRHGWYSKEDESFKEEESRLFKALFEKHPDLFPLNIDSLDTHKEEDLEFFEF
jgi:hypothetical protein